MAKTNKQKTANKSGSSFFWIVIIIAICLLALIIFLSNKTSNTTEEVKPFNFDYSNQPFEGDEKAPVEVVEFGDYKCPVCKDFNESVYPVIQKDFVDTGKVKFYFMNFPFINKDSTRSAEFAETVYKELGNDTFWKFHHLLFNKQPEDPKYEKMDYFTMKFLKDTLGEIVGKEDVKKVEEAYNNKVYADALAKDDSYVKETGVNSTPTLFINGKQFSGKTYEDFINELKEATK